MSGSAYLMVNSFNLPHNDFADRSTIADVRAVLSGRVHTVEHLQIGVTNLRKLPFDRRSGIDPPDLRGA